jgi:hypothetical protein
MKIDPSQAPRGSIEAKDPFAMAPPGYGLTSDNQQWPWGQPPQIVDPQEALQTAIAKLNRKKNKRELMKLLIVGASVEVIVEGYIFQAFSEGQFTPDVGLLIKGPLAMVIAGMAEEEGIPYRFFENDDELEKDEMDDATFFRMMKQNNPGMFSVINEKINSDIRRGYIPEEPQEENFMNMKPTMEEAE